MAKTAEADPTPAAHKEVRLTLLEVDRLRGDLMRTCVDDRNTMEMSEYSR